MLGLTCLDLSVLPTRSISLDCSPAERTIAGWCSTNGCTRTVIVRDSRNKIIAAAVAATIF
ncbi:hypothetical protein F383_09138 [Gossypium arboreum]|uniref:Uncharacterized protein n=1 Tax=Gossypium arboreum TaxID=29729 RepID=A0A0B0NF55_GOSAR|nr:hypothetical protein F383_09138 [Gossypium arboreum]